VPPLVYDPLGPWAKSSGSLSMTSLKPLGLFATAAAGGPRAKPVSAYLARGRDDVVFNIPDDPNQDVTNRFSADGIREYKGKFTWAALLTRPATSAIPAGTAFVPGDDALLTVVVFHQGDASQGLVSLGTYTAGAGELTLQDDQAPLISGRRDSDLLRTGAVIALEPPASTSPQPPSPPAAGSYSVRRLSLASLITDKDGHATGAFVEFEGGEPVGTTFTAYLIPDAVAVLERQVTIEGPNRYLP
jgi:hypothetical protein